jgi:hypothetical protein
MSWRKMIGSIGAGLFAKATNDEPEPPRETVTILGYDKYPALQCFDELRDAVAALEAASQNPRTIVFGAHLAPDDVPPGAIVYNLENVPMQVPRASFAGHELWDFSTRNVEQWKGRAGDHPPVHHVPVGYHPSMERFARKPWAERDIDVVFTGHLSTRRAELLNAIKARGLNVVHVPIPTFGAERDAYLARAKLAINVLYENAWIFPFPRAAHLVANRVPMLSEHAPEAPEWALDQCSAEEMPALCAKLIAAGEAALDEMAESAYRAFKRHPLALPAGAGEKRDPWAVLRGPGPWDVAAVYDAERGGPVSEVPVVAICLPKYRESGHVAEVVNDSLSRIEDDLHDHGIATGRIRITGDSLIQRGRMRLAHRFLKSPATHMLFCDGDIEAVDPGCVRKMLATGYDVVAGACPFKNSSGAVVCNLWPQTHSSLTDGAQVSFPHGCIEVMDAGTGFMLISREALFRMMQAHPELLHWSRDAGDWGEPLWALFDTGIVDGVYQSEDFMFCRLWQGMGEKVYVYVPATFRHWGEHGYEGSFEQQYGLVAR